uniref:Uncharacterized protein n=1 Tax=Romanomermis culicivorax TaxID=13658 RepID=A0A915K3Q0_ROMCU
MVLLTNLQSMINEQTWHDEPKDNWQRRRLPNTNFRIMERRMDEVLRSVFTRKAKNELSPNRVEKEQNLLSDRQKIYIKIMIES